MKQVGKISVGKTNQEEIKIKLEPVGKFYRNIPNKVCIHCGEEFIEQYESYSMQCHRCINIDYQS